ncbi:olfactory receptor-like protein DTMT [Leptodactylus fuscus]|uniref:olfactory receptor-like protein DTMT n=1 Tax=Leptodactylus fuscus TaxID=238119 RepID=UPI003F4EBAF8
METKNRTVIITEFILLGFTTDPKINAALFVLFFIIYLIYAVLVVNGSECQLLVVMAYDRYVAICHPLHYPVLMRWGNCYKLVSLVFIYNFIFSAVPSISSPISLCYNQINHFMCEVIAVVKLASLPRLLVDLFSRERTISYLGCVLQIYAILVVNNSESQILVVMAYDRYVAICHPLHYPVLMRWGNCYKLLTLVFIYSFALSVVPSIFSPIVLCYNRVNHFMCELTAVVKLACEDISANELQIFSISFLTLLLPLVLIFLSYACIIYSVMKIRSAGRSKAFSTCTSHLAVVTLYFGTAMLLYFGPSSMYSTDYEKYTSMCYVIISPMLNPLIYSLNNKEVRDAFKKSLTNS